MEYDVFICHASEDKATIAKPLADELLAQGINVWFDEYVLKIGDSLRRSIDRGLASCRYGVVILSPNFFKKEWPQKELDGLVARETDEERRVLPIWHGITLEEIRKISPPLADRVALSSEYGLESIVNGLLHVIGKTTHKKRKMHDLTLDLRQSTICKEKTQNYKLLLAMKEDGDEFYDFCTMLEKDRSKEAVAILFEIANRPDPWGGASYGIGSLARIGNGAIPEIIQLLRSEEPLRAFTMFDSIMELDSYVDTNTDNVLSFMKILTNHPEWPEALFNLERHLPNKDINDDWKERYQKSLQNLRAATISGNSEGI